MKFKPVITVVYVLEAGACIEGVLEFVKEQIGYQIKAPAVLFPDEDWIQDAATGEHPRDAGSAYESLHCIGADGVSQEISEIGAYAYGIAGPGRFGGVEAPYVNEAQGCSCDGYHPPWQ